MGTGMAKTGGASATRSFRYLASPAMAILLVWTGLKTRKAGQPQEDQFDLCIVLQPDDALA